MNIPGVIWKNSPGFFIYLGLYLFVIKIGMAQSRQLAAIMFTDIVGYTALMGEDEQKAFDLLRKNRQMQGIDRDNPTHNCTLKPLQQQYAT